MDFPRADVNVSGDFPRAGLQGGRWLGEGILVFLSKAKKFKLQRSDLRFGEAECVKEIETVLGRRAICHASPFLLSVCVTSCSPLSSLSLAPPQKVLGLLLAHSADVNARDKLWQTPLHVAAANRATKCAEALAPLLSSLNVADRSGRSALHHAVHSGHLEVRSVPV